MRTSGAVSWGEKLQRVSISTTPQYVLHVALNLVKSLAVRLIIYLWHCNVETKQSPNTKHSLPNRAELLRRDNMEKGSRESGPLVMVRLTCGNKRVLESQHLSFMCSHICVKYRLAASVGMQWSAYGCKPTRLDERCCYL